MQNINYSDMSIIPRSKIDNFLLKNFYKEIHPNKDISKVSDWKTNFLSNEGIEPLVILYNDNVIAHAGIIPLKVMIEGNIYIASWYIDLSILPQFQRMGLGTMITKEWMKLTDIHITHCNEKSMGIFKKLGWLQSPESYYHIYLINPFQIRKKLIDIIPEKIKLLLNKFTKPILIYFYRKYVIYNNNLYFENLNKTTLKKFLDKLIIPNCGIIPIRDKEYAYWRFLDSPECKKYKLVSYKGKNNFFVIIKLYGKNNEQYLDILWISNPFNKKLIRSMISSIALWALKNSIIYIRQYTSDIHLSNYLKKSLKPIVRHPIFAYNSIDKRLIKKLTKKNWNWELLDSDLENFI